MEQKCQSCSQKDRCQDVFKKLGEFKGPSVLLKVVQGFLLPLLIFIGSLVAAQRILAGIIATSALKDLAAFLAGAVAVFLYVLAIRFWSCKD